MATSTSAGGFGWLLPDLHGNVAGAIGSNGSAVSDAFRYSAYGTSIGASTSSLPSPWRFQGRLALNSDDGSGNNTDLYDFVARSYDPNLAAFTSLDSVAGGAQNPLTLNRFLYALASPATLIDPNGHYVDWGNDANGNQSAVAQNKNRAAIAAFRVRERVRQQWAAANTTQRARNSTSSGNAGGPRIALSTPPPTPPPGPRPCIPGDPNCRDLFDPPVIGTRPTSGPPGEAFNAVVHGAAHYLDWKSDRILEEGLEQAAFLRKSPAVHTGAGIFNNALNGFEVKLAQGRGWAVQTGTGIEAGALRAAGNALGYASTGLGIGLAAVDQWEQDDGRGDESRLFRAAIKGLLVGGGGYVGAAFGAGCVEGGPLVIGCAAAGGVIGGSAGSLLSDGLLTLTDVASDVFDFVLGRP
ncbi:MAG: RHS repeat-associated core domain-containing protein [Chloroflexota bacterium]